MATPHDDSPEPGANPSAPRVRLDKWLWAARFYKTRSQATDAINAGHVKAKGQRTKSGHFVAVGAMIEIVKDQISWEIEVVVLSDKRGSGADAQRLYRETVDGKARREQQLEALRTARAGTPYLAGRPTKRDRRALDRFRVGGEPDGS